MRFRLKNFRASFLTAVFIIVVLILFASPSKKPAPKDEFRPIAAKKSQRGIPDVSVLLPRQKTPDFCANELVKTLFLVHTAPSHFFDRDQLRSYLIGPPEVAVVFALGRTENSTLDFLVAEEANMRNDMIIFPFLDTYRNLTLKFVNAIRWIKNECYLPGIQSVVKVDDDVWVNMPMLQRYLIEELPKRQDRIHCLVWRRVRVARRLESKWFVSKNEFHLSYYPPYCGGLAYIVPYHLLQPLAEASYHEPFFWVDDVYATGLLARRSHIGHAQIRSYYAMEPNETALLTLDWSETMNNVFGGTHFMFAHMNTELLRKIRTLLFQSIDSTKFNMSKFDVF